jgi:hypothetical protein
LRPPRPPRLSSSGRPYPSASRSTAPPERHYVDSFATMRLAIARVILAWLPRCLLCLRASPTGAGRESTSLQLARSPGATTLKIKPVTAQCRRDFLPRRQRPPAMLALARAAHNGESAWFGPGIPCGRLQRRRRVIRFRGNALGLW